MTPEEKKEIDKKAHIARNNNINKKLTFKRILNQMLDKDNQEKKIELVSSMLERACDVHNKGGVRDAELLLKLSGELNDDKTPSVETNFTLKID